MSDKTIKKLFSASFKPAEKQAKVYDASEPVMKPKDEKPLEGKKDEDTTVDKGGVENGKPEKEDVHTSDTTNLDNTDADKAVDDMSTGLKKQVDKATSGSNDAVKGDDPSVIRTARTKDEAEDLPKISHATKDYIVDWVDALNDSATNVIDLQKLASCLGEGMTVKEAAAHKNVVRNVQGVRDGAGPFIDSAQKSISDVGKRQEAGLPCPAKDEDSKSEDADEDSKSEDAKEIEDSDKKKKKVREDLEKEKQEASNEEKTSEADSEKSKSTDTTKQSETVKRAVRIAKALENQRHKTQIKKAIRQVKALSKKAEGAGAEYYDRPIPHPHANTPPRRSLLRRILGSPRPNPQQPGTPEGAGADARPVYYDKPGPQQPRQKQRIGPKLNNKPYSYEQDLARAFEGGEGSQQALNRAIMSLWPRQDSSYAPQRQKTPRVKKKSATREKKSTIKHEGDKWVLYNKEGTKVLGRHDSKEEAEKQEKAIQVNKHGSLNKAANKDMLIKLAIQLAKDRS